MATSKSKNGHDQHADGIVEDRKQSPPIYFQILFFGLILWGAVFCGYYLFSGWSSGQEFQEKMKAHNAIYEKSAPQNPVPATKAPAMSAAAASPASSETNPATLFVSNCAGCHGADGKGGYGPDLSGPYKYGKNPADIKVSISEGRAGKMPGFDGKLKPAEIDALVDFVLNL